MLIIFVTIFSRPAGLKDEELIVVEHEVGMSGQAAHSIHAMRKSVKEKGRTKKDFFISSEFRRGPVGVMMSTKISQNGMFSYLMANYGITMATIMLLSSL